MKIAFKKLSIALLFMSGMGSVSADPSQQSGWHGDMRVIRLQQVFKLQGQALGGNHGQREDPRRIRNSLAPQEGYGGRANETANAGPDEPRKGGRMTPEQRRALRRQINEASRDLYAAPR